jgi:hypothetical protein
MSFSIERIYAATMASANSLAVFQRLGNTFDNVYLQIPTMSSGANLEVRASLDGLSYYGVRKPILQTATVTTFVVAASAAANGAIVPLPPGFEYYQLVADSAPTAATTFNLICGD